MRESPQPTQNPYEINIFGLSSREIIKELFDNAIGVSSDHSTKAPPTQKDKTEQ